MDPDAVLKEFEQAEAILKGHFVLTSGLHSDTYLQCARVLMDGVRGERLCKALAAMVEERLGKDQIDLVVAPAMGGVIVGYELARQLKVPSIFCERVEGEFTLRRGFAIESGARVLIVEDVITTGTSSREAMECVRQHGGVIIGEAGLVDRSAGNVDLGVPLITLMGLHVPTYQPDRLPPHLVSVPAVKPGSRGLQKERVAG